MSTDLKTITENVQKKSAILNLLTQVKNAPDTIARINAAVTANTPKLKAYIVSDEARTVLGEDFDAIKAQIDAL